MFNRSSFSFSVITVLSMINIPCFALDPPPKGNSLVSIPAFYFSPPIFMPILARLRSNKDITDLINKVQNSQKNPKQQNKSPLNENENAQIQLAIQKILSETVNRTKSVMQKISNENKCIIHFKTETDIQLAPGFPLQIELLTVPTENLTKEEAEYIKAYSAAFSKLQEKFKLLLEEIAKEIPQMNQNTIQDAKDKSAIQKGAKIGGA